MMEQCFPDRDAAASAVAVRIESALQRQLASRAKASFVVSGGSTPAATFTQLAQKDMAWRQVQVLLSDERWVSPEHADSNENMLRERLITSSATSLRLLPFYADGTSVEDRCAVMEKAIRKLPLPFACALLGMGEDGHFASLFPGTSNLRLGLDPDSDTLCIPVTTGSSPYNRISLTLAALLMSEEIMLLAYGEKKRAVIAQAARGESDLPVSHLLKQQRTPVRVFWAP